MAEELGRPTGGGPIVVRLLVGAVVLFAVLTVIGWIVGAVLAVLRAIVVVVAVAAVAVVLLRGVGRD